MSFFKELGEYLLELKAHRMVISLKTLINSMNNIAESVVWYDKEVNLNNLDVKYNSDGYINILAKREDRSGEGTEYLKVLVMKNNILCAGEDVTINDEVLIMRLSNSIYIRSTDENHVPIAHIIEPSTCLITIITECLNSIYWNVNHNIYVADPDDIGNIMAAIMEYNSYIVTNGNHHLKMELEYRKDELLLYNYNKEKLYFKITFTYETSGMLYISKLDHNMQDFEY